MRTLQDKIRGSLIGGAIGDALGYPVEFMSLASIKKKYGERGITGFELQNGKAVISDDTQMTLFTANGLLFGITRWCTHGMLADLPSFVRDAYQEWYQTQTGKVDYAKYHLCWIRDIAKLNVRRAPGNTCMSALSDTNNVNNDSKGCGGIMRVAPVAMVIASEVQRGNDHWVDNVVQKYASECAAITHKHPMGYICAAVFADILYQIFMCDEKISMELFLEFIGNADEHARSLFVGEREKKECANLRQQIDNAIRLSKSSLSDSEAINLLGEGWTGDETLTIALLCTLRHIDNFHAAMVAAVNHNGDSDSTGAVCGNLMGAIVGQDVYGFPGVQNLELKTLLLEIADDIVKGCTISEYHSPSDEDEKQWEKRYVFAEDYLTPFDVNFLHRLPHIMLPKAVRMKKAARLLKMIDEKQTLSEKCSVAYEMARVIFDDKGSYVEEPDYYRYCKELLPAYYWGYLDSVYSPDCGHRIFKLNAYCYRGKSPIIAVRDDCGCHKYGLDDVFAYELKAGLERVTDTELLAKYPDWLLLRINPNTVDSKGFAVFTNMLEKEFVVEVAHLGDDGKLHRIYRLNY